MAPCKFQLIIHSANGLTNVKYFGTMIPYVVVWIVKDGKRLDEELYQTEVAKLGASDPVWNYTRQLEVTTVMQSADCRHALLFEIKHKGTLFDRDIGQVEVPFKDLLAGNGIGENISYPVKISSGKMKGQIVLSLTKRCPRKEISERMIEIAKRVVGTGFQVAVMALLS